ncbi:MAG: metallophosphoesterase family protein [Chloroflexota bacterium]
MRFAVIANIHGNRSALEAVLEDIESRSPNVDRVIAAGDLIGRGPEPNEVLDLLRSKTIDSARGNYDEAVALGLDSSGSDFAERAEEEADRVALRWTREKLTPENLEFVTTLPRNLRLSTVGQGVKVSRSRGDERIAEYRRTFIRRAVFGGLFQARPTVGRRIVVVHGSPRALNEFVRDDTARSILATVQNEAHADVLITAHAGNGFQREYEGMTIIGAGAASGYGNTARYIVVNITDHIESEFLEVEYDREPYEFALRRSGLPAIIVQV